MQVLETIKNRTEVLLSWLCTLTGHPASLVVANSMARILNKSNKYSSVS